MRISKRCVSFAVMSSMLCLAGEGAAWPRRAMTRYVGSYDAAMQVPVAYDFVGGASDATLSRSQIEAPLTAVLPRLVRCVAQERSRHNTLDAVQLHVVLGRDGRVMGATVDQGSAAFQRCAVGVVRALRWTSFTAPRLSFSWGFTVQ